MSIRAALAKKAGQATKLALNLTGREGSSLPGKVAMGLSPEILKSLSKNYRVIVVTGTNGKTQTTALITEIFRTHFKTVLTNPSGANMLQGVVSCFLSAKESKGSRFAVLEVDEATLKYVTAHIDVEVILFTNVFRDQMDRYGEIYSTWQMMLDGARLAPKATIICNGDLPLFHEPSLPNQVRRFGFDHLSDGDELAHYNTDGVLCPQCDNVLHYRFNVYSNLGKYFCPHCGLKRHHLDWRMSGIEALTPEASTFYLDGTRYHIPVGGIYNIYNALAAYAVAKHFGFSDAAIRLGFDNARGVFGRQEKLSIAGREVVLNLIKNPVGFNQIVELLALDDEPFSLMMLLNDRPADGTDVSWIWDGDFEKLVHLTHGRPIVASGIRFEDLKTRLTVAGAAQEDVYCEGDLTRLADLVQNMVDQKVYVLATYTAILDLRKIWKSQGHLKEGRID